MPPQLAAESPGMYVNPADLYKRPVDPVPPGSLGSSRLDPDCIRAASPQMSTSSREDAVVPKTFEIHSDQPDKPKRRGRPAVQDSQRRVRKTRQRQGTNDEQNQDGRKRNGLRSPVSAEMMVSNDRANSTPTGSGSSNLEHDCHLRFDQSDLDCLEPGRPLNYEIINTFFCLLAALFPLPSGSSTLSPSPADLLRNTNSSATLFHPELITFVPIYFPSFQSCEEHWVLCVVDSTGIWVWDPMPAEHNTQVVSEILSSHQRHALGSIKEVDCPRTGSFDTGVAIIVNAVCIVSATLGSEMRLPEIREGFLWRDVLKFMLRIRIGDPFRLCWGSEFDDDTVLLECSDSEDNDGWELLCSKSRVSISYEAASKAIQHQQQRLDIAAAEKRERRDRIVTSGACIRDILACLATLAASQRNQLDRLQEDSENLENSLRLLIRVDECLFKVSSTATEEYPPTASLQSETRDRLQETMICRARGDFMVKTLNMTARAVSEAVETLEAGK